MYNKVDILKQIGWYDNVDSNSHEKLTNLFNCMVKYFTTNDLKTPYTFPEDIYIGGYYPINPQTSFTILIKRAYKFIEPTTKSIHQTYCAYCNFLKSPQVNDVAHQMIPVISDSFEFELIDMFITKTYGQIF